MLVRLGIRVGASLVGIVIGLLISTAALSGFSIGVDGFIEATLLFWVTQLGVQFVALRVLIRQPSIALAGLLALASTIVALVIVNFVVSGLKIHGASTYVFATLIIWMCTAFADSIGRRMIRERRRERRDRGRDE